MMAIDKLINYLERKTADTAELQAASAITQLRSELQEAKEVITVQNMALEDYGITHDQQAQEIERLREQLDTLITALDKCKFDSCNLPIDQWREVCIALANIKEKV